MEDTILARFTSKIFQTKFLSTIIEKYKYTFAFSISFEKKVLQRVKKYNPLLRKSVRTIV